MRRISALLSSLLFLVTIASGFSTDGFKRGKVEIKSFSTIAFGPDGILFAGDTKSGKIFALDLEDNTPSGLLDGFQLEDVETKVAAFLATDKEGVIIHDLAVNPISQNIYLAVSRNNARELGFWKLPNDIGYANILIKISRQGEISEVSLDNINHDSMILKDAAPEGEKTWRGSDKRTETITDIEFYNGKIFIAGLSNEEFTSSLRVVNFPFEGEMISSTIEIWHAAHGKFETEAPIRTLLPYKFDNRDQLLAAYTCTPLVSIPFSDIENGNHVKGTTLAELGSGNMPLDIITYLKNDKEYILIANSSRSLMRIDPDYLNNARPVTEDIDNSETAGVPYIPLSKVGILQVDNLNRDNVLTLQRMPNGNLDLRSYSTKWL